MSTSNLGSGFDCFALALGNYLVIEAEKNPGGYEVIRSAAVPELAGLGAEDDLIIKGYRSFFKRAGLNPDPVKIRVLAQTPVGKGLGSSAAAIVGGIAAAGKLSGIPLKSEEMINLAYQMERHPDNIVAAVLGGFTASILIGDDYVAPYRLPISEEYRIVAAIPDFSVKTEDARNILPIEIPLRHAVYNIGRAVMLAEALRKGSTGNLQGFLDD
ncbi:MAG: homoserine kinase, partial [Deltaproteobacteria bacterium]|nr:homoserine kinase [Deltaproteobacteria bacterium]